MFEVSQILEFLRYSNFQTIKKQTFSLFVPDAIRILKEIFDNYFISQ